jgi:hypothetical protein
VFDAVDAGHDVRSRVSNVLLVVGCEAEILGNPTSIDRKRITTTARIEIGFFIFPPSSIVFLPKNQTLQKR